MSSDGKPDNQIDHFLIDMGRHSIVLEVRSIRAADCDMGHYLVVANIKEIAAVNKEGPHKFHMETFSFRNLNEVEGKEKYCVDVSNRFAALEDLDSEVEINTVWETMRENIKFSAKESLGYYELKKHKSWFDEGCSKLLDQRKQAKLQWLQDLNEINRDNLNNVRYEACIHFRNNKQTRHCCQ
jgi:hypothetical protein